MNWRRLALGWLFALLLCPSFAQAENLKAWGYLGWWLPQSWRTIPLGQLDRLLFFELKVAGNGEISERNGWPEQWRDLQLAVQQNNTPLDLTLTLFEPRLFNQLFSSPEATQRLLSNASALAAQAGVAGLQLDFEIYSGAQATAIEHYRHFVRALAAQLRQQTPPRNLSVFFPMGASTQLYDATTLREFNQVVLQGYDSHWRSSQRAGPVAPLSGADAVTWTKAVTQGLLLGVPKERLLLGFPLYGYEWPVKGRKLRGATLAEGVPTSFAPVPAGMPRDIQINVQDQVRRHGASHDPVSGSSYYQFQKENGQWIEGWFEDWWSLGRKTDYLTEQQLGGIAFFLLGYDGGQLVDYFLRRRGPRSLQDFIKRLPGAQAGTP